MPNTRHVFFVSDRTGITAETLGNGLLTQFEGIEFKKSTLPFVTTPEKARDTVDYINYLARSEGTQPLVFSTTVSDEIRDILRGTDAVFLDLFDTFIPSLERELGVKSTHQAGRAHGLSDQARYRLRMDAVNFALEHDDGLSVRKLDQADVILIAPSRCGKTPTSLYLAMQHGIYATNFPLTEDDLETQRVPKALAGYEAKLFGLTSDPERLHQVRSERRPGSRYASLAQCGYELRQAESLYRKLRIPFVNTASMSVEEIATVAMQEKDIRRGSF
jgi:[pyruvate, water dikinase]-phosphate phosphotransferase / [pyruvate, water dikinase] kinase